MIQHLKKGQSAQAKASNQAQVSATVEGILDAHYLGGKAALAEEAIKKLEDYRATPNKKPA